MLPFNFQPAHG